MSQCVWHGPLQQYCGDWATWSVGKGRIRGIKGRWCARLKLPAALFPFLRSFKHINTFTGKPQPDTPDSNCKDSVTPASAPMPCGQVTACVITGYTVPCRPREQCRQLAPLAGAGSTMRVVLQADNRRKLALLGSGDPPVSQLTYLQSPEWPASSWSRRHQGVWPVWARLLKCLQPDVLGQGARVHRPARRVCGSDMPTVLGKLPCSLLR